MYAIHVARYTKLNANEIDTMYALITRLEDNNTNLQQVF